jgi:hypothetical protein
MKKAAQTAVVPPEFPVCVVSDGVSAYVKTCKAAGIKSGAAVRHYRAAIAKGRKAVLKLVSADTSTVTSFGIKGRKDGTKGFRLYGSL